jgi:hypothetical protein
MGVLFEVFARHVCRVMPEVLPLAAVRTIVDVGARAGFASIYLLRAIRMYVSTASSRTSGGVIRLGLRATRLPAQTAHGGHVPAPTFSLNPSDWATY